MLAKILDRYRTLISRWTQPYCDWCGNPIEKGSPIHWNGATYHNGKCINEQLVAQDNAQARARNRDARLQRGYGPRWQ